MAYSSQGELEKRFGELEIRQLSDRNGDNVPDTGVVDGAIADADSEIDSYLSDAGYTVPLSTPPATIVRCSCDIARYYLFRANKPQEVTDGYNRALKYLTDLANGKLALPNTAPEEEPRTSVAVGTKTLYYSDDFLSQYNPDD